MSNIYARTTFISRLAGVGKVWGSGPPSLLLFGPCCLHGACLRPRTACTHGLALADAGVLAGVSSPRPARHVASMQSCITSFHASTAEPGVTDQRVQSCWYTRASTSSSLRPAPSFHACLRGISHHVLSAGGHPVHGVDVCQSHPVQGRRVCMELENLGHG